MTVSTIHGLEHTVHLTNEWLIQLKERLDWADNQRSYRLLRSALQALRDWLDVNEAAHLGAQLPMLVRGIYYEGWHPAKTPVKERSKDAFIARLESQFETDPMEDPQEALRAVFWLLDTRVSEGEIEDVKHALPKQLRELWPK